MVDPLPRKQNAQATSEITCILFSDSSFFDFCANATTVREVTYLVFNQRTAPIAVNNRRLITCTCAVQSSMTFKASLVDGRLACNRGKLYCDHPVISGLSGLSSRCISKAAESRYFYYNKDYGSSQGPEFKKLIPYVHFTTLVATYR